MEAVAADAFGSIDTAAASVTSSLEVRIAQISRLSAPVASLSRVAADRLSSSQAESVMAARIDGLQADLAAAKAVTAEALSRCEALSQSCQGMSDAAIEWEARCTALTSETHAYRERATALATDVAALKTANAKLLCDLDTARAAGPPTVIAPAELPSEFRDVDLVTSSPAGRRLQQQQTGGAVEALPGFGIHTAIDPAHLSCGTLNEPGGHDEVERALRLELADAHTLLRLARAQEESLKEAVRELQVSACALLC
jgi:hypothetical protein